MVRPWPGNTGRTEGVRRTCTWKGSCSLGRGVRWGGERGGQGSPFWFGEAVGEVSAPSLWWAGAAGRQLMLGVTLPGPSGRDISEVSFQTPASRLTRTQAASGARAAVRITPTFNYSQQPVHTRCHLTSSPVPSQRQRCFQQRRAAVRQSRRSLCPVLSPPCKTPAEVARLHREGKEGIKPLVPHPSAPTAFVGSSRGALVDARPRDYKKQEGRRENKYGCWTGTRSTSLELCARQILITEDNFVVPFTSQHFSLTPFPFHLGCCSCI